MIISGHPQGSDEWMAKRRGIPTASMFGKIITSTGEASKSATGYMNELLADWYIGERVDQWEGNEWTERGNELEPDARDLYSYITGNAVDEVGFINHDLLRTGCSPDGLIGKDGLVELKCPKGSTMIAYILANKLPTKYKPQVQGQLWITERKWCDFMAYHPKFEPFLIRVERDNEYIAAIENRVLLFLDKMSVKQKALRP